MCLGCAHAREPWQVQELLYQFAWLRREGGLALTLGGRRLVPTTFRAPPSGAPQSDPGTPAPAPPPPPPSLRCDDPDYPRIVQAAGALLRDTQPPRRRKITYELAQKQLDDWDGVDRHSEGYGDGQKLQRLFRTISDRLKLPKEQRLHLRDAVADARDQLAWEAARSRP